MKHNADQNLITRPAEGQMTAAPFGGTLLILLPLYIGLAGMCCRLFSMTAAAGMGLAAFVTALSAALLWLYRGKFGMWVLPAGCLLVLLCGVMFRGTLLSGMQYLANFIRDRLSGVTGEIWLSRASMENPLPALLAGGVLCALLLTRAAMKGNLIPALPVLLPLLAGVGAGLIPADAFFALAVCGFALIPCGGSTLKSGAARLGIAVLCALLAIGTAGVLQKLPADAWNRSIRHTIHALRYDNASNSMPEGRLRDLGARRRSDTPALKLTMEQPQKLYLRGGVYEVYTGTAWEELAPQTLADSEALFYWLHSEENDFYGQGQLAKADRLTLGTEPCGMTVENLSACSGHAYLPYAFADTVLLSARQIGDAGSRETIERFAYLPGSLPEWFEVQREIAARQSALSAYHDSEEAYADYAETNDLSMTEECWNVLYRQLGDRTGTHSLGEILTTIRSYLDEHMYYDESVRTHSGDGDFLRCTLEYGGAGYSVHYATAATLMLRYFGVPARYVEGYFLSAEEAQRYAAGEEIVLTENHAHAWAEYYLSGVGFVPFEVTPGYMDDEELAIGSDGEDENDTSLRYTANPMSYVQQQQPEAQLPEEGEHTSLHAGLVWLLIALLLLLAAVLWVAYQRLRLRQYLRRIDAAENREAVQGRYIYAQSLAGCCPAAALPDGEDAERLYKEAAFSDHELTAAHRERMDAYAGEVLAACRRAWTFTEKIRWRLLHAIY